MENNQSASLSCTNEPEVDLYEYFRKHLQSEYMPIFKPGYGYEEEWALFGTNIITKYSFGARVNGDATKWFEERNQIKDLLKGSIPMLSEEKSLSNNTIVSRLEISKINKGNIDASKLSVPADYNKFEQR